MSLPPFTLSEQRCVPGLWHLSYCIVLSRACGAVCHGRLAWPHEATVQTNLSLVGVLSPCTVRAISGEYELSSTHPGCHHFLPWFSSPLPSVSLNIRLTHRYCAILGKLHVGHLLPSSEGNMAQLLAKAKQILCFPRSWLQGSSPGKKGRGKQVCVGRAKAFAQNRSHPSP